MSVSCSRCLPTYHIKFALLFIHVQASAIHCRYTCILFVACKQRLVCMICSITNYLSLWNSTKVSYSPTFHDQLEIVSRCSALLYLLFADNDVDYRMEGSSFSWQCESQKAVLVVQTLDSIVQSLRVPRGQTSSFISTGLFAASIHFSCGIQTCQYT